MDLHNQLGFPHSSMHCLSQIDSSRVGFLVYVIIIIIFCFKNFYCIYLEAEQRRERDLSNLPSAGSGPQRAEMARAGLGQEPGAPSRSTQVGSRGLISYSPLPSQALWQGARLEAEPLGFEPVLPRGMPALAGCTGPSPLPLPSPRLTRPSLGTSVSCHLLTRTSVQTSLTVTSLETRSPKTVPG